MPLTDEPTYGTFPLPLPGGDRILTTRAQIAALQSPEFDTNPRFPKTNDERREQLAVRLLAGWLGDNAKPGTEAYELAARHALGVLTDRLVHWGAVQPMTSVASTPAQPFGLV